MWNNKQFVTMASRFIEAVLPSMVKSLEMNITWHWSESVKQLTVRVKNLLMEMEPVLYSKCFEELARHESIMEQETIKRKKRWEMIELRAANAPLSEIR
jgi:serine/threonine-protein phosphatase 2A regulatory subunit B'